MRVGGDQDERGGGVGGTRHRRGHAYSAPGRGARGAGLEVYRKTSGSVTTTSRGTVRMLAWQLRRGEGWRRCSCQRLSSARRRQSLSRGSLSAARQYGACAGEWHGLRWLLDVPDCLIPSPCRTPSEVGRPPFAMPTWRRRRRREIRDTTASRPGGLGRERSMGDSRETKAVGARPEQGRLEGYEAVGVRPV